MTLSWSAATRRMFLCGETLDRNAALRVVQGRQCSEQQRQQQHALWSRRDKRVCGLPSGNVGDSDYD